MQIASFIDKFLSPDKQIVILTEGFVQNLPYSESTFWKHLSHVDPILFTLSCDVFLLLTFRQLLDWFLDCFFKHLFSFVSRVHPLDEEIYNKNWIDLKVGSEVNPLLLLLNSWCGLKFFNFFLLLSSSLVFLHGSLLFLPCLLFFFKFLFKYSVSFLFAHVLTFVSYFVNKKVKLRDWVNR